MTCATPSPRYVATPDPCRCHFFHPSHRPNRRPPRRLTHPSSPAFPDAAQCYNGGYCSTGHTAETAGRSCQCPGDWQGPRCQEPVTQCPGGFHCFNGGTCSVSGDGRCHCPTEWMGHRCDIAVQRERCADGSLCLHGGTCTNSSSGDPCNCPARNAGRFCQIQDVVKCSGGGYCENAGVCSEDGESCICELGFVGPTCGNTDRSHLTARNNRGALADGDARLALAVATPLVFVVVVMCGFMAHMVRRERKGNPLFGRDDAKPMDIEVSDFNTQRGVAA